MRISSSLKMRRESEAKNLLRCRAILLTLPTQDLFISPPINTPSDRLGKISHYHASINVIKLVYKKLVKVIAILPKNLAKTNIRRCYRVYFILTFTLLFLHY